MKVFKFGGASVKDAEGVKNVVQVLQKLLKKLQMPIITKRKNYIF